MHSAMSSFGMASEARVFAARRNHFNTGRWRTTLLHAVRSPRPIPSDQASMPGGLDHAFARLAAAIAARPGRILLVVALVVVAAAPFAIRVRSALEPRGLDVANSNSERARETIERDARFDPTNNVLLLFRARAPLQQRPSRERLRNLAGKLAADPAVVRVLDAPGAHNPAMIGRDGRSTYLIAQLRPLDDKEAEAAGTRIRATFAGDADVT